MKKAKSIVAIISVALLLFSFGKMTGAPVKQDGNKSNSSQTKTSSSTGTKNVQATQLKTGGSKTVQTKAKTTKPVSKTVQSKPSSGQSATLKSLKDDGTVKIGTQSWSVANLNVTTFRNGDTIPEAKTNKDWVIAGDSKKPAWCYYNNDAANGKKFGKLYNWYAVNDPRGLAPEGWTLPGASDWATLTRYLGGLGSVGSKMKSSTGWTDGYDGTNETGFTGLPGGYRMENGLFLNFGNMAIWWSSDESNSRNAIDHYLSQSNSLSASDNPKQCGEYVRCIRK